MKCKFSVTDKQRTVLVVDDIIVSSVEDVIGFENVRTLIVDSIVDNLTDTLTDNGVDLNTKLKEQLSKKEIKEKEKIKEVNQKTYVDLLYYLLSLLVSVFVISSWIMGIVLAVGWYKLIASVFPFYAWYLVISKFLQLFQFI